MDHGLKLPNLQWIGITRCLAASPIEQLAEDEVGYGDDCGWCSHFLRDDLWVGVGQGEGWEGIWTIDACWRGCHDGWVSQ